MGLTEGDASLSRWINAGPEILSVLCEFEDNMSDRVDDTNIMSKNYMQCSKWKLSRNGTLVKILEHSKEQFMFSSYNQSRRNGTLIPLHLTNRNGVPVRSGPFRALTICTNNVRRCYQTGTSY